MHPTLFKIGNFPVQSYGVLLVIGFIVAITLSARRAHLFGLTADNIYDLSLPVIFAGVLGARGFYIVQEWSYFSQHPEKLFSLRFDGLTSFGGFVMGGLALLGWCRWKKVSVVRVIDCIAPGLLVANAIGRLGCLANGCCHGLASDAWCAVVQGANREQHYLPAQLIEVGLDLAFAGLLARWTPRFLRWPGLVGGWSLALLGLGRFIYEFWRAGSREDVANGLASSTRIPGLLITEAQVMALAFVVVGCVVAMAAKRRPPETGETT
jgi:phosphatidylglycerol:prolipoprotein diacylglycerol transferase